MKFEYLSPEQQRQAIDQAIGKSADELEKLATENGIELTNEQLDQIAGGGWFPSSALEKGCPDCGSLNVHVSSIGQDHALQVQRLRQGVDVGALLTSFL